MSTQNGEELSLNMCVYVVLVFVNMCICMCVCVCMTCEYREKGMGTFYYKHKQLSQVKMQLFEKRMDWHHH